MSKPYEFLLGSSDVHYSQRNNEFTDVRIGQRSKPDDNGKLKGSVINYDSECNVTNLCEAATIAGIALPLGKYKQDEDNLADFIISDCLKDDNWFRRNMPDLWKDWIEGNPKAYTPLELHGVLVHYFNEWIGIPDFDKFSMNIKIKDFVKQIVINKLPIPTSVAFPFIYKSGTEGIMNHIITITGFKWNNEQNMVDIEDEIIKSLVKNDMNDYFIRPDVVYYSDSYGQYDKNKKKYISPNGGWKNEFAWYDFIRFVKDPTRKDVKWGHLFTPRTPAV